jgi:hypothetical protein
MRKIGVAIGLLAFAGLGYAWFSPSDKSEELALKAVKVSTYDESAIDSDGDGLKDWEEVLWNSNPMAKDSDGDGTSDGDEVEGRRNPTKAGPDDAIVLKTEATTTIDTPYQYSFDTDLGETLTDRVSLNLTSNFLLAKSKGALSQSDKDNLVEAIVDDSLSLLPSPRVYTKENLTTTPTSKTSLRQYFNSLAKIVKTSESLTKGNELAIMEAAKDSQNIESLRALSEIGREYTNVAKKISELVVPTSLVSGHLALANELSMAGWGLEMMGDESADPTTVLLGFQAYQNSYLNLITKVMPAITAPIKTGQVAFLSGDPAKLFTP